MSVIVKEAAISEKQMVAEAEAALADIARVRKGIGRVIFGQESVVARTSAGFAAEHRSVVEGWTVPEGIGGERWILAECEATALPDAPTVWANLPHPEFRLIRDAGLLVYFSHPQVIADLVAEA